MSSKVHKLLLYLILLLAFILRFWNYNERYGTGYDGSRDAIVSFESARQFQLPLTGSFSSIGPITFGPWYYWFITFSNFIIPSIWAPWMTIGLSSFFMVFLMYQIGKILEGKNFGLFLAFITAFSPAQLIASTPLQQHALIGLLSSLILYLFIKISLKDTSDGVRKHSSEVEGSKKLSVTWGFLLGFAINTHFQSTGLLVIPLLYFLFKKNFKIIPYFILGLFISMIPILIFELNNHWFNTRNIIDYILIGQYRIWTSNRWLTFIGKFWPEFWSYVVGAPFVLSFSIMISSALLFLTQFLRKKLSLTLIIICISFAIQVIILRYYRGEKFFGYLQFFHPYLFLFTGYLLYFLMNKVKNLKFSLFLIFIYSVLVLPNTLSVIKPDQLNLDTKARIKLLANTYPQEKFSTYACKHIYDVDRIQALLLILYMQNLYDEKARKVTIANPTCSYFHGKRLDLELVEISELSDAQLDEGRMQPMTPLGIYNEVARWWFKEQP